MPKGRDKELIEKRNRKLMSRYYYWTEKQRLRYDDTLRVLSREEFFISEERIEAVIRECYRQMDALPEITVPKTRRPKISVTQLMLFADEE
jgi:hypothetical protein